MAKKPMDWRHYIAAIVIVLVILVTVWRSTIAASPALPSDKIPAGSNAMTHDPNSP